MIYSFKKRINMAFCEKFHQTNLMLFEEQNNYIKIKVYKWQS